MTARDVDIVPVGDAAAMAILGDSIDLATVRSAWRIADLVRERMGARALDVVPAYASVLVRFDPAKVELAHVMACLRGALSAQASADASRARTLRIGVRFGGEFGADLDEASAAVGLKPDRYVAKFCGAEYRVAFVGFIAGFPYLMGLPDELAVPRRSAPRDRVPAGSVAIAGTQCGIYPRVSPGGWRLLGVTRATIFDHARRPPALFAPGNRVRFESVERVDDARAEVEP